MVDGETKRGSVWTSDEVERAIDTYFQMLALELGGAAYKKIEFNRELDRRIGRGKGSIEYKFQNISAALAEIGAIPIMGYKPAVNMQALLRQRVRERVAVANDLRRQMVRVVDVPPADGIRSLREPSAPPDGAKVPRRVTRIPRRIDFQAREAANRALGRPGEEAVVAWERCRLTHLGRGDLAAKVRNVAQELGDGLGYDVLSFDAATGMERFLEVKTTRYTELQPFLISRNEVDLSEEEPERFTLVRLYEFDSPRAGQYRLNGALTETADLRAEQYSGIPRHAVGSGG